MIYNYTTKNRFSSAKSKRSVAALFRLVLQASGRFVPARDLRNQRRRMRNVGIRQADRLGNIAGNHRVGDGSVLFLNVPADLGASRQSPVSRRLFKQHRVEVDEPTRAARGNETGMKRAMSRFPLRIDLFLIVGRARRR